MRCHRHEAARARSESASSYPESGALHAVAKVVLLHVIDDQALKDPLLVCGRAAAPCRSGHVDVLANSSREVLEQGLQHAARILRSDLGLRRLLRLPLVAAGCHRERASLCVSFSCQYIIALLPA